MVTPAGPCNLKISCPSTELQLTTGSAKDARDEREVLQQAQGRQHRLALL